MRNIANCLVEIGHFTLEDASIPKLSVKIVPNKDKAPQDINWLRMDSRLAPIVYRGLSVTSRFPTSTTVSASASASSSIEKMGDGNIPTFEIEKMVEKLVVASLKRFLRFDKGKDHVIMEDEENQGEAEKKEQADKMWQDDVFFAKKVTTKMSSLRQSLLRNLRRWTRN
ncbi:hypothetical protein JCGZ_11025 [Jatropha curcas]|uniref:Uncharacterized protein n=1 Tax=Jatropha curcas TaxID=180498 RepID=A0A067KJ78_JATCU|nr:hypothetical protein JCGZ_11025 [Jatropha curcas]